MFELNQPWQPPWILTKLSPCITTMMRCVQESPRPQTKRWVSGCYMMPGWGSFGNQLIPASIISFYFCTSHERCIVVVNSTCTMWYETLSSFRSWTHPLICAGKTTVNKFRYNCHILWMHTAWCIMGKNAMHKTTTTTKVWCSLHLNARPL